MQLTLSTDYAVRSILYLCMVGRLTKASEVSEQMRIPKQYLTTMARRLKDAGIIDAQPGQAGGYYLKKEPQDITMFDIISVTEETINLNRCLEHDRFCSRFATESCPVREFYVDLQDTLEQKMKSVTMADLLAKLEPAK